MWLLTVNSPLSPRSSTASSKPCLLWHSTFFRGRGDGGGRFDVVWTDYLRRPETRDAISRAVKAQVGPLFPPFRKIAVHNRGKHCRARYAYPVEQLLSRFSPSHAGDPDPDSFFFFRGATSEADRPAFEDFGNFFKNDRENRRGCDVTADGEHPRSRGRRTSC